MLKKLIAVLLAFALCLSLTACGGEGGEQSADTRVITDLIGRQITIPNDPQRIAAMTGPSYEMVFMLEGKGKMCMTKTGHTTNYPLALLTNPDLANYETVGANPSSAVNIEDYLSRNIDLIIYYSNDNELKKFDAVNIPAVVLTLNEGLLTDVESVMSQSVDEYIETSTIAAKTLAEIINTDEARAEYDKWYAYNVEKINMLSERTANLTDEQRPVVYWGNTWGENVLASYALKNRIYEINLAGGRLVGPLAGNGSFPEVTSEQLFEWDPVIILVDNHGNFPELVIKSMYKDTTKWATLSAVKNKQLYRIPAGVFFLDKGTTTTLMLVWLATVIQPELFSDIDVLAEIQYYYQEFYEYNMTRDEAQKVLDGWYDSNEDWKKSE